MATLHPKDVVASESWYRQRIEILSREERACAAPGVCRRLERRSEPVPERLIELPDRLHNHPDFVTIKNAVTIVKNHSTTSERVMDFLK